MKILIIDDNRSVAEKMSKIITDFLIGAEVTVCSMSYSPDQSPRLRIPDIDTVQRLIESHDLILIDHNLGQIEFDGSILARFCQKNGKFHIGISSHSSFCKTNFMAKHELDIHPAFVEAFENILADTIAEMKKI
ncbi:MAG TPA: hypothetical protein PKE08_02660, partial [Candidatus Paceibacterota bacterium]|nr:hypothetical protein [Candidatus Paceibacterota bacterium]